jgi:serine/threonine protein kinase
MDKQYVAPELQNDFAHGDVRSDIYALGITLQELLAAPHPGLTQLIQQMLVQNPEERISANKLVAEFDVLAKELGLDEKRNELDKRMEAPVKALSEEWARAVARRHLVTVSSMHFFRLEEELMKELSAFEDDLFREWCDRERNRFTSLADLNRQGVDISSMSSALKSLRCKEVRAVGLLRISEAHRTHDGAAKLKHALQILGANLRSMEGQHRALRDALIETARRLEKAAGISSLTKLIERWSSFNLITGKR